MKLANLLQEEEGIVYATPDFYSNITVNTDDAYYAYQWGLQNTGQSGGIPNIDIKAYAAWNYINDNQFGINTGIKVGVIDDGVEPHEDFYYGGGVCKVLYGYTASHHRPLYCKTVDFGRRRFGCENIDSAVAC